MKASKMLALILKRTTLLHVMKKQISDHTLKLLQYDDVLKIIARYCTTSEGRERLLHTVPETNPEKFYEIDAIKELGQTVLSLQNVLNASTLQYFPPLTEFFNDDKNFLQIEEIYAVGLFTRTVSELKQWSNSYTENTQNSVSLYIKAIPDLSEIETIIFSLIDKNGKLQNIPTLKKLEREIAAHEEDLQKTLRRYFSDDAYAKMLQSNVATIRDARHVIAVKANFKGRIAGIIHEYSQSGQTFYIEPSDVVEKNNNIMEAQARYNAELKRILNETSQKIFLQRNEVKVALEKVAKLDCVFASVAIAKEKSWNFLNSMALGKNEEKAKPAKAPNLIESKDTSEYASFFLKQARHPLLKNPVAIDLILSEKTRVLIITGPNAGGKTVTLKTVCLFALLNQAGFPVPCEAESTLPYFDFIACDIGDDQSIDLSLSTFSSHMKTIAGILENASDKSLLALDELGSGTEPQEGSAIAMAILDDLLEKHSYVFVTSHHGSLKNYGYTKEHCENASVEFDTTTLQASYKIIMGVPGESHAFEIASKSGLSEHIIKNAKQFLAENRADISKLIKDLIEKNKQANKIIEAVNEKERSINEKIRKVDLKELKLKQNELNLREQGYRRLENFFLEKRKELENLIREIREGELSREKILSSKKWLDDFGVDLQKEENEIHKEKSSLIKNKAPKEKKLFSFNEGDDVFSLDYNRRGTILRKEKNDVYLIELGNLKLSVKGDRLEPLEKKETQISVGVELSKSEKPVFELRLLGMRELEAKKALTNQLDLAVISSLKEFSIVHGKGDGILQKMVHEALSQNNFVEEFHFARPEEGGTGKTFVRMK